MIILKNITSLFSKRLFQNSNPNYSLCFSSLTLEKTDFKLKLSTSFLNQPYQLTFRSLLKRWIFNVAKISLLSSFMENKKYPHMHFPWYLPFRPLPETDPKEHNVNTTLEENILFPLYQVRTEVLEKWKF